MTTGTGRLEVAAVHDDAEQRDGGRAFHARGQQSPGGLHHRPVIGWEQRLEFTCCILCRAGRKFWTSINQQELVGEGRIPRHRHRHPHPGASIPTGQGGHVPANRLFMKGGVHGNVLPQYFRSDVV